MTILVEFILAALFFLIFGKRYYFFFTGKSIKRMRKSGKMPYPSEGTLTFDDTHITVTTAEGESRLLYSAIEKIGVTKKAIFAYQSALQAIIIPAACFAGEEEKQKFLDFLKSKTNKG